MSTIHRPPVRSDIQVRVLDATARLLLEVGSRRLRSVHIANAAGTTESTLFRHFKSLDEILAETYAWAWSIVVDAISRNSLVRPLASNGEEQLIADMRALFEMRDDDREHTAATVAFLFMRRKNELIPDCSESPTEELIFRERITNLCESILLDQTDFSTAEELEHESRKMSIFLLNYSATVWLTWFAMPVGTSDFTEEVHDLSVDEAVMGVLDVVRRFSSEMSAPLEAAARNAKKRTEA